MTHKPQRRMLILASDDCTEEMLDTAQFIVKKSWFCNWEIWHDTRNETAMEVAKHCRALQATRRKFPEGSDIARLLRTNQVDRLFILEMASGCSPRLSTLERIAKKHGVEVVTRFFG